MAVVLVSSSVTLILALILCAWFKSKVVYCLSCCDRFIKTSKLQNFATSMDKGTKKTQNPKCRLYWCFVEFIDWRYSQLCWYFRHLIWNVALLYLLYTYWYYITQMLTTCKSCFWMKMSMGPFFLSLWPTLMLHVVGYGVILTFYNLFDPWYQWYYQCCLYTSIHKCADIPSCNDHRFGGC